MFTNAASQRVGVERYHGITVACRSPTLLLSVLAWSRSMAHRMSFDRSNDNDLTRPGPARLASIAPIESTDQSDPIEQIRLSTNTL